ncbi:hypothetical protein [Sulfurimonas sp.]|uniref:hypothetical protein n=1 Tax=Sulfurimonas sp. TaxID=2022749 RepID=UPI002B48E242|nr:hypothetical protein [Sulfurimonas sp.]
MNRSSFALFVALLIHLLFIVFFLLLNNFSSEIKKTIKPPEKKIKISLREMPKTDKKSVMTKKKVKPPEIAPPMPKGSQLKKIIKKPLIKLKPKAKPKKPRLNPKPKPKPKVELIPSNKPYIPLLDKNASKKKPPKKEEKKSKNALSWMYEDKSSEEEIKKETKTHTGSSVSQNVKELYGEEFGKLTQGQQAYIIDNQEIMRRITQQVLTRVAGVNLSRSMNVNRSNVIEFYLHPNGDMSDFKFLEKSGYYILDDTTKETISYAYSRYPRPKEKTLIKYVVYYNLARY